jgi:hypothetical protein
VDWETRSKLARMERFIAAACGEELAKQPPDKNEAWSWGLLLAWRQIHVLVQTGQLVDVDKDAMT